VSGGRVPDLLLITSLGLHSSNDGLKEFERTEQPNRGSFCCWWLLLLFFFFLPCLFLSLTILCVDSPLLLIPEIEKRLDLVNFFFISAQVRDRIRHSLHSCFDMERALQRLSLGSYTLASYLQHQLIHSSFQVVVAREI